MDYIALPTRTQEHHKAKTKVGPPYEIFGISRTGDHYGCTVGIAPYFRVTGVTNGDLQMEKLDPASDIHTKVQKWVGIFKDEIRLPGGFVQTTERPLRAVLNSPKSKCIVTEEQVRELLSA